MLFRSYLNKAAERHGIKPDKLEIKVNSFGTKADDILKGVYERADEAIAAKDARITELENQIREAQGSEIPYEQITRELLYKYPDVQSLILSRGSAVSVAQDSTSASGNLTMTPCINALVRTATPLEGSQIEEITKWLRIRLGDDTVVVSNVVSQSNNQ